MDTSTIAAIASPPGIGGIGIIKISGPDAINIALRTFRHHKTASDTNRHPKQPVATDLQTHRLYYGHITDPETGNILDEVLLGIMRAPRTYTREDVVEIQGHSGPAVMRDVLALVIREGARLAEPGEFTRRAFINGRIDLTQAEAVIDLISARTDAASRAATNQVFGKLRHVVKRVHNNLTNLLVQIEAQIDFPEDVDDTLVTIAEDTVLHETIADPIGELIRHYQEGHIYRDGIDLSIVGRPNVGKSSLLNRLVGKDRAIVNPIPGTTRDLVECAFQFKGIPVNVIDTAGIHSTEDPIEKIGISKTKACIDNAQLNMLVLDASEPIGAADQKVYDHCKNKPFIYVLNKIDLVNGQKNTAFSIPLHWKNAAQISTSALKGTGIDELRDQIVGEVVESPQSTSSHSIIPNIRQYVALEKCSQNVLRIIDGLRQNNPPELIVIDIRDALDQLGGIIGLSVDIDVLDRIFSRFCIGK
jgi:tRNA modification GTPase